MSTKTPEYTFREFEKIAIKNGYSLKSKRGTHCKFIKPGVKLNLVVPKNAKALCIMLTRRLIKEHNLIT